MYFKINGLILTKKNIKETSAIVYILTQELGIIKTKIEGINKSESKLISVIQAGSYGKFFITLQGDFYKILSFLPLRIPFKVFKKFPYTYLWALRFLKNFNFLYLTPSTFKTIINLDKILLKNYNTFLIWFLILIFEELGVLPNLTHCYKCNYKLNDKIYYYRSKFFCDNCRKLSYEKLDSYFYKKLLYNFQKDKIVYLKNPEIIDFLKKLLKSHLKEIIL